MSEREKNPTMPELLGTLIDSHIKNLQATIDQLRVDRDLLRGGKFSDRDYWAIKSRAEGAEKQLDEIREAWKPVKRYIDDSPYIEDGRLIPYQHQEVNCTFGDLRKLAKLMEVKG